MLFIREKGVAMVAGAGLTGYDSVVIALLALLVIRGIWLGFLRQITGLVALYLGYIVAGQHHAKLSPFLREISANPKVVFFASWAILFVAAYIAVMLAGKMLNYVMKLTVTSWFDRILGGLLGAAKALLLIMILHMGLRLITPPENTMLMVCRTCNALNKTADFAQSLIKDEDVKKVFSQQKAAESIQAVKEFIETPPKEKPRGDKASSEKTPAEKPAPEKPQPEKSSPVQ